MEPIQVTDDKIVKSLQTCIHENFPRAKQADVNVTDDLYEEGIVDSLGFLTIINFIEDEFGITVDDEDVLPENFNSISSMAEYVKRSLNGSKVQDN